MIPHLIVDLDWLIFLVAKNHVIKSYDRITIQ